MTVYLKLQDCRVRKEKATTAVQICGDPPYEIAVRFANCCLKCPLCFAAGYSHADKFGKNKELISGVPIDQIASDYRAIPYPNMNNGYNWMRILGGEPLLNDEYISYLFDAIYQMADIGADKFNYGIVIQTNGIHIGKGNTGVLLQKIKHLEKKHPKILIVIETSIKGTNSEEFEVVTRSSKNYYQFNIVSYFNLKKLNMQNLRPMVVAGFGINTSYLLGNSLNRITLYKNNKPFYHPDGWDLNFKSLYADFTDSYSHVDPLFHKMPMYGIEDRPNWKWCFPALKRGRQELSNYIYDNKYDGVNTELENNFEEITKKFFFKSPSIYYNAMLKRI